MGKEKCILTLDPQIKSFLDEYYSYEGSPLERISKIMANKEPFVENIPMHEVKDITITGTHGEIPLRIYKPNNAINQPAIIYFHGGGFHTGSIETHDGICRNIASYTNFTIISVGYHLAPEYKFPVAVYDAYESTKWVFENAENLGLDPTKIGVSGDSAGGNLAIVVTHLAREKREFSLAFQVLLYPLTTAEETESMRENGQGYMSDLERIQEAMDLYLRGPEDKYNLLFSPMLNDDFNDIPPALIITGKYDSMRDDSKMYAEKLKEKQVPVKYVCYDDLIHGFLSLPLDLKQKKNTYQQIAEWLKDTV